MKVCIVLGTRPEIIKMAPVIRECIRRGIDYFVVHSGQHYSYNMDRLFFEQLELPDANYNLEVGSLPGYAQTAKIMEKVGPIFESERPDVVLVQGDTNTVAAGAIAARKLNIKVGHVEAGLRNYDERMPEELNRVLADHCSTYLFAPNILEKKLLRREGIPRERIFVTGNTIVDSVLQNVELADESILKDLGLEPGAYLLVTMHRQESVEFRDILKGMLEGVDAVQKHIGLPVVFPIHPRTKRKIEEFQLKIPEGVKVIEPVGFLDFLALEKNARLILTDSGGVQEEACILRVPCVTMRTSTERPETVEAGANMIGGTNPEGILNAALEMLARNRNWKNPLGDGNAAKKIISIISKDYEKNYEK
ncbi:MAG: UDP-N-acetylglucosamine 2-epimerase (non-hydrolyzing) [Candidatus Woesearchaeota archaeon]